MRALARAEGRFARYDGRWRDRDPAEAPAGVAPTVRIKSPLAGDTVIDDRVQGRVAFPNADLDDFVILRSDGTPTYMLAVVVDDHDMGVTHIIRGDDHFTNAARQKILYDALGWPLPVMAHIPLIHGPDGAKLSKRHGALGIDAYRAMGYLPEALRNYLVRLGWSHGDDEIMSDADMIAWFDVDAIGRAPARIDFAKLESLNAHYLRSKSDADLMATLAGGAAPSPRRRRIRGQARCRPSRPAAGGDAAHQGARQDPGRPDRRRPLPRRRTAARPRRRCRRAARRGRRAPCSPASTRRWPRSTIGRRAGTESRGQGVRRKPKD